MLEKGVWRMSSPVVVFSSSLVLPFLIYSFPRDFLLLKAWGQQLFYNKRWLDSGVRHRNGFSRGVRFGGCVSNGFGVEFGHSGFGGRLGTSLPDRIWFEDCYYTHKTKSIRNQEIMSSKSRCRFRTYIRVRRAKMGRTSPLLASQPSSFSDRMFGNPPLGFSGNR